MAKQGDAAQRSAVTRRKRLLTILLGAAVLVGTMTACAPPKSTASGAAGDGGDKTLTVGMIGDAAETLDPHNPVSAAAGELRTTQLYDGLTRFGEDGNIEWSLAVGMTHSADLKTWTVKLRPNVKFHDGSSFGADDVIFSVKRILDPKRNASGAPLISFIDPDGLKKIDDHTVQFTLTKAYGPFKDVWADIYLFMVPTGFDPEHPVGTGPFKYVSATPGQQSTFTRFDGYWGKKPHFGTLKVVDFPGMEAIANALRGGQIDVAPQVSPSQATALEKEQGIAVDKVKANYHLTMFMRTDIPPFNDVRVRQAMRLLIDRKQVVANAFDGLGQIGNDISVRTGKCVPDLPQRRQDIPQAKKLLSEAGQSGLSFQLTTAPGQPGTIEMAQIFAENAKKAGVTVKVKQLDSAGYLAKWTEWPFGMGYSSAPYLIYLKNNLLPGGGSNASRWEDAEFDGLADTLFTTADESERCELQKKLLTIEYKRSGQIIPAWTDLLVAHRDRVSGIAHPVNGYPMYDMSGIRIK